MTDTFDVVFWSVVILIVVPFTYFIWHSEFTITSEMEEVCERFGGEYSYVENHGRVCFKQGNVYPFIKVNGRYEVLSGSVSNYD